MSSTRLLLAEDDPRIASFIKRGLEAEGYVVTLVNDGEQALTRARSGQYPLIILDRMMPKLDGLAVCRQLRDEGNQNAILMLTAKERLQDKIDGLKGGADDYVTKPFAFDELLARLEVLSRRSRTTESQGVLKVLDLTLDLTGKIAWRGDRKIVLTPKEFALLTFLMTNSGTVVSRARLLSNVWGLSFDPGTKIVDVYIRYLRRKIDENELRPLIQTVRGFGYTLRAPEAEQDLT